MLLLGNFIFFLTLVIFLPFFIFVFPLFTVASIISHGLLRFFYQTFHVFQLALQGLLIDPTGLPSTAITLFLICRFLFVPFVTFMRSGVGTNLELVIISELHRVVQVNCLGYMFRTSFTTFIALIVFFILCLLIMGRCISLLLIMIIFNINRKLFLDWRNGRLWRRNLLKHIYTFMGHLYARVISPYRSSITRCYLSLISFILLL